MYRSALRQVARTVCTRAVIRAAPLSARCAPARAFSVSVSKLGSGTTDVSLMQKLQEEMTYEKETMENADPEFLKEFKALGIWTIEDKSGQDEVVLSRKFGNESIRAVFSIADIQNEPSEEFDEDAENEKEEQEEEGNGEQEEDVLHSFPIRVALTMTKEGGAGSLGIDMVCQEGNFLIENVTYYPDPKIATDVSVEADWARRGLYMGPPFDSLDVGLQEQFEQWLGERGINETIALFVPEYSEYKEQKEYITWLNGVKKFVEL